MYVHMRYFHYLFPHKTLLTRLQKHEARWQHTYKERHNRICDVSHRRTMTTTITMTMPMTSRTTRTITTAAATAPALDSPSADSSAEDVAGSVALPTARETFISLLNQQLIPYTRILPQKHKHAHKNTLTFMSLPGARVLRSLPPAVPMSTVNVYSVVGSRSPITTLELVVLTVLTARATRPTWEDGWYVTKYTGNPLALWRVSGVQLTRAALLLFTHSTFTLLTRAVGAACKLCFSQNTKSLKINQLCNQCHRIVKAVHVESIRLQYQLSPQEK